MVTDSTSNEGPRLKAGFQGLEDLDPKPCTPGECMMHEVGLCAVPLVGYVMGKGALVQLQVRAGSADNALGVQEVTVLPSLHTNSDS